MLTPLESLRRTPLYAVLLLTILIPATPQNPANTASTQEISTHDAPAIFSAKVNLVTVPVVVRDKQGHTVGNLREENFELTEGGKPQIITRFGVDKSGVSSIRAVSGVNGVTAESAKAVPGAEAAPPLPERFVIYLFDDLHLEAGDMLRVRQAARDHLAKTLETTARAAIYTTSGIAPLDFTDDQDKLTAALNGIKPYTPAGSGQEACPPLSFYEADQIVSYNNTQALAAAMIDAQACSGITNQAALTALVQGTANGALRFGQLESEQVLNMLKSSIQRLGAAPGSRSIVLVSSGFYVTRDRLQDEQDLIDRAIRANVAVGSLDARGLYTIIPGGDASQRGFSSASASIRAQFQREEALANEDAMEEISDATGGKFFHNDNGLEDGLNEIAARPEYIYVLAFSPQNLKYDGAYHKLKVTLKQSKDTKDLQLQARRGYYSPKRPADPAQQAAEEIREAVFSREELRDLSADLNLQYFKSSDTDATLAVLAKVDLSQLHYRKADDRNVNTVTLVASVFDTNGNYLKGTQKIVDLKLKDETLAKLPAGGVTLRTNFDVAAGSSYSVRLVLRDAEGQTMAARNGSVRIP
jgi:VWFA-related protein